jgi:cysteine desulfurase / selenocysteine lyase
VSGDVYLDNAATSWPKPPVVLEAMQEFLADAGGSPGRSGHHRSIATSRAVSLARENLAELLGAESPDELIFTKNATEGLNIAIYGLAEGVGRIVTTSLEHNSVMRPLRDLEQRGRCIVEVVHADGNTGAIDLDEWAAALRSGRCLAVAVHACNVTGVLLPIVELAAIARDAGVPFVVDASQSAGHVPLSLPRLGASAAAMPGHKGLLGPMGTGLLYLAPGVEPEPLLRGGTGSRSESEYQPDFAPDRY